MIKYQSEKKYATNRSQAEDENQTNSYVLKDQQETQRQFKRWKQMKQKIERSNYKFNVFGSIQRAEKFSKMHPIIYKEGIKRIFKEMGLFPKASQPDKMRIISLLWDAATVKNKIIPAKTPHLVLILKQLLDSLDTTSNRQKRIIDAILLNCQEQIIVPPSIILLKNLAVDLVKQVNLINGLKQGLSARKYSSPNLKSIPKKSPMKTQQSKASFFKKIEKVSKFKTSNLSPNLSGSKSNKSVKKSPSKCRNLLRQQYPLFELQIQINNKDVIIPVFRGESSVDALQRLRQKMDLSVLMKHELKCMIEEFIQQHSQ